MLSMCVFSIASPASLLPTTTHTHSHAHMHAHIHVHAHTHTHARTHARTHTCTHTRTHARTHARTHTHTPGAQQKRMHNLRLLCGDPLDLCRHKTPTFPGPVVPHPERLQTAMSLYSSKLSALILLVDDRVSAHRGMKEGESRICAGGAVRVCAYC